MQLFSHCFLLLLFFTPFSVSKCFLSKVKKSPRCTVFGLSVLSAECRHREHQRLRHSSNSQRAWITRRRSVVNVNCHAASFYEAQKQRDATCSAAKVRCQVYTRPSAVCLGCTLLSRLRHFLIAFFWRDETSFCVNYYRGGKKSVFILNSWMPSDGFSVFYRPFIKWLYTIHSC